MAVLSFGFGSSAQAVAVLYSDEAAYLAAAGPVVIEDFETSPPVLTKQLSISFPLFTVSSDPSAVKVLNAPDPNGNHAASGTNFLSFDTDLGALAARATLTFAIPIKSIGFYAIDVEDGLSVLDNSPIGVNSASGQQRYFGMVSDDSFTVVTLYAGNTDSHWSIDKIAVVRVPEPSAPLIFTAIGMTAMARRRSLRS
jgi:hypothetical protein